MLLIREITIGAGLIEFQHSIIELASEDVSRVVFKDNGFASDADKTNIKETLRTHNIDEFITI